MCTRIVRRLPLAAGILVLGGVAAKAQEAPEPQASQEVILEEVVVTAPKEEKPAGGGTAGQSAARKQQIKEQVTLEGAVVTTAKVQQSAIDALSGSSAVSKQVLDEQFQATRVSDVLNTLPGVSTSETATDTAQSINIRGLQDFGRVNVLIEGARQNFQRSGHNANGGFYIEPEMIGGIDVTRGPTSMIYGSGAIGGVVYFGLLDADDILKAGEYAAAQIKGNYGTNGDSRLGSFTTAARSGGFDILGQTNFRDSNDYEDGGGNTIAFSGEETQSNLVNARWRPVKGHEITASVIDLTSEFVDRTTSGAGVTLRDSELQNNQYTLGYTYYRPDTPLLDFSAKIYRNDTRLDQVAIGSGQARYFDITTEGFDVHNTSRFSFKSTELALTYGADGFQDEVETFDPGNGDEFTPGGERQAFGTFFQGKMTFFEMIDLIGAVRYDSYELEGNGGTGSEGDRVSPKVTVAATPLTGMTFFATYAEGYRAPAITETLVSGTHPAPVQFNLLPNPNLRPEVAHNFEGGVNLKYNNVLKSSDAFRAKVTAFHNEVDDYIDAVYTDNAHNNLPGNVGCAPPTPFPVCFFDDTFQYENIAKARIQGVELEATYDAQSWFVSLAAQHIVGKNADTGQQLVTVLPDKAVATIGFRMLNETLVAGTRVSVVDSHEGGSLEAGSVYPATDAYALVDLFAQYQVNEAVALNLNVDNLFDKEYLQYLDQDNSPGFNARVGMTMRLGAK
jgi:hemoglobin/transferrin/lactoferrin receptor protein